MRRRLFWALSGVAALTGMLVLAGAVVASQRAAVDATYRALQVSADEAVTVINDFFSDDGNRPGAVIEILRLLDEDQLGTVLRRIRRTAGGSELGFAAVAQDGTLRTNAPLFSRLDVVGKTFTPGLATRTRSTTGELVVITPTVATVGNVDVTLLVALARSAPIVRLQDQSGGLFLLVGGIVVLAALAARILSNQLAARLEPLADASRKVARGDMAARVPDLGDPELDAVGTAFNEMAHELETARAREREFILGVGHDLRTPLTTIGGYAEALEAGGLGDADLERIGSVLGVQSAQIERLIEDLTTLAGLEQPEFSLRKEMVDVGAHVREVVEGFDRRAEELGVALDVESDDGMMLETDPDRLGQIAQNLVENALRHTPAGGDVRVSVADKDGSVEISVADSGSGIAPEDLPFVFDRHFVGRQRSVHKEGSGLGLSIVKGLVDRMGGNVVAESALGKGTTIRVSLAR
ncbi:MAG: HAMP domain-containing sensor histidine kinase [Acidimicrobiia bacterium]